MRDSLDLPGLREQAAQIQTQAKRSYYIGTLGAFLLGIWIVFSDGAWRLSDSLLRVGLPTLVLSIFLWSTFVELFLKRRIQLGQLHRSRVLINPILPPEAQRDWNAPVRFTWEIPMSLSLWTLTFALWLDRQDRLLLVIGLLWLGFSAWGLWRVVRYARGLKTDFERRAIYGVLLSEAANYLILLVICAALVHVELLAGLAALLGFVLFTRVWAFAMQRLYNWTLAPYFVGDYPATLKRMRFTRRVQPQVVRYITLEGAVLGAMGRFDEATRLHYAVMIHPNVDLVTLALAVGELAGIYQERDQFAEALKLVETAVQIAPDVWVLYLAVADWYLMQFSDGERALELAEFALELINVPGNKPTRFGFGLAYLRVAQAAALAERPSRLNVALEKAIEYTDLKQSVEAARLEYYQGYINHAQHDAASARQHYQRVLELDPHGTYGRNAARLLQRLDG
ncbi:MAG: hypothetical protein U0694_09750 [Anaerolineae bacterium]